MNVAFEFENDGSDHDDLVLKVGESVWRCDSYYLALDRRLLPDQEDARKVRTVLRALLENWRAAVVNLDDGATAYLPYDFSDEGTAWLACELHDRELHVRRGWATVAGWSLSPSAPLTPTSPAGFHPDAGASWRVTVDDFLRGIAQSIEAAG